MRTFKQPSATRLLLNAALAAALSLTPSCQTTRRQSQAKTQNTEPKPLPFTKFSVRQAAIVDDSPLAITEDSQPTDAKPPAKGAAEPKDGILLQRIQAPDTRPELANRPQNPALLRSGLDEKVKLNLSLQAATVEHVAMAFADRQVLDFNYMVDPAVKGAISLNMNDVEMTRKEAWELLEHLLWLSGAYMSESNGFVHILPFEKMPKEQKLYVSHDKQPNVQAMFIDIRHRKSADVINFIKPFMTDGATATDIPDANTICIVETPANTEKLLELIQRLDSKGEGAWPVQCLLCREVDPETLVEELQQPPPIIGFPVAAANGPSGGAIKLTALPRLNAIVISASLEEVLQEVAKWARTLDRQDSADKEGIYFYNVKFSTVEILSAALDAFFNTTTTVSPTPTSSSSRSSSSSSSSSSSRRTSLSSRNSTSNASTGASTGTTTRNTASTTAARTNTAKTATSADGRINKATLSVFETDVTVFTEDESNRLTIKTTPRAWNTIRAFLERQDLPPRQVAIRAIITEVTLSDSLNYGLSYLMQKHFHSTSGNVSGGFAGAGAIKGGESLIDMSQWSSAGLGLLFTNANNNPMVLIEAAAGKANTKILSEPQIIARSGATAELQVGESVPVATESTNYTNSDGNFSTNYEYLETGVIMTVTPFITAGNEVRLEIEQEVSSAIEQSNTTNSNVPPTIDKKKMKTELVVPDNTTILMGGMIKNRNAENFTGIPILMDIPYLGQLFRSNNLSNSRTELLILITVNVIDNKQPQEELIRKYKLSLETIEEQNGKNASY